MANIEHLNFLKQSLEAWNQWRKDSEIEPDLRGADLAGVDLRDADLIGVCLNGAKLRKTNLAGARLIVADLIDADLTEAHLYQADLTEANLTGANLTGANLDGANLTEAILENTNFAHAECSVTVFGNVDLSKAKGLEAIKHGRPSTVGINTLLNSHGRIAESFLRACGMPENFIISLPGLMAGHVLTMANSVFGSPITDHKLQCDVFMIMPFSQPFQPIYEDHIKSAVQGLGYTIKRGDDFFGKTSIMTDIWSAINNTKLIIAECTGRNPNVFYELGIAHSLDKSVVMITQNMDDIPFDIRHLRVIKYEYSPRGVKDFEATLKVAISNLLDK